MKVLIIGGVAAGATTAARLRRLNKDVEMIVLKRKLCVLCQLWIALLCIW